MNKEIKEILNYFVIHSTDEELEMLSKISIHITNLQEENKKLKKQLNAKEKLTKIMPKDTEFIILTKADYERQEKDIELIALEQKQRIDKAIEYIKIPIVYETNNIEDLEKTNKSRNDDLLNILQGSNKE